MSFACALLGAPPAERKSGVRQYRIDVPGLSAHTILYDEVNHCLMVGLYLVPLSVTQYVLIMRLLRQRLRWTESRCQVPLFVSVPDLMELAQAARPEYIKQHLSRANESLRRHQIVVGCLHGWGYGIFNAAEMPPLAALGPSLALVGEG